MCMHMRIWHLLPIRSTGPYLANNSEECINGHRHLETSSIYRKTAYLLLKNILGDASGNYILLFSSNQSNKSQTMLKESNNHGSPCIVIYNHVIHFLQIWQNCCWLYRISHMLNWPYVPTMEVQQNSNQKQQSATIRVQYDIWRL